MTEDKELTGIERELVLQYLRDDNVPVTVTLEEKPGQVDANLKDSQVQILPDTKRVSASTVFPVAIKSQQLTVLDKGIILLKNDVRSVKDFLGKSVRVQFYFNRLGLYFITTMKECSQGLALVVPGSIKRIKDSVKKQEYGLSTELFYIQNEDKIVIPCEPSLSYPLFVIPKWGDIVLDKQQKAKSYLEKFVAEVKTGKSASIGNGIHLFPVCKFLTDEKTQESQAVEGRVEPLKIIFVDNNRIVFAANDNNLSLSLESEYSLNLTFAMESNKLLRRIITVTCIVDNIYLSDENESRCFACHLENVKEEDSRFLFERTYGKKIE